MKFWNLRWWDSGERQVIDERLNDIRRNHGTINPVKADMYKALKLTPFESCRVMFCGQDPYPDHKYASGLAFSIPETEDRMPPALSTIFDEYESDLHLPRPKNGSLEGWAKQGVLLWNVIPTCLAGHSLSHDWDEYHFLTGEIISKLVEKGCVFVFLGSRARAYASLTKANNCISIETSHPSPRALLRSNSAYSFLGSRVFSRTNDALNTLKLRPVDWRL